MNFLSLVLTPMYLIKAELSLGDRSQEDEWLDLTELRRKKNKMTQFVYEYSTHQAGSVSQMMIDSVS